MSDETMKDEDDEIPEIRDFSGGVIGKYYGRIRQAPNVVRLDPDLVAEFPDSESVNRTLRRVLQGRRRRRRRSSEASTRS